MSGPTLRLGIVGAGAISGAYGAHIAEQPTLSIVAATDLDSERSAAFCAEHGGVPVSSLDEMLRLDLDVVVNLTVPSQHYAVTKAALEAGKHVHSEKPLAPTGELAWELVQLAEERGLRLSCSPFTLMGEAQQTAWKLIRAGSIGRVRAVYAETDWGRIETWHPAPQSFYAVGPVADVGIYPLAVVTGILGPVRQVTAVGRTLLAERMTTGGVPFTLDRPDTYLVVLDLEDGTVVRLTSSFYTGKQAKGHAGVAFHGDTGSLWLDDSMMFDGSVELAPLGDEEVHSPVPLVRSSPPSFDWSRALTDLGDAIAEGRPHRASGAHAAHLVDVLSAVDRSVETGGAPIAVTSSFPPPLPMPWAEA